FEHGQIRRAVGVEPALGERGVVTRGVRLRELALPRPVAERAERLAGEAAVCDLEPVREEVVEREVPRDVLREVGRRRREEHDAMAGAAMLVDALPALVADALLDLFLPERPRAGDDRRLFLSGESLDRPLEDLLHVEEPGL